MTTTDDDLEACPDCGAAARTVFKPPDGIEIHCSECSARTVSVESRDAARCRLEPAAGDPDDPRQ
jgi:DNA-directed RNA polymerase subunit RPC12/RpoP